MQATQISTHQHLGVGLPAALAIDGDLETSMDDFSYTHTRKWISTIEHVFSASKNVSAVRLWS